MNPTIKKKWVKALRSGKYIQGKNKLQTNDGKFCCLGVLCDIHSKEKGKKWTRSISFDTLNYLDASGLLPNEVSKWAGLKDNDPYVTSPKHEKTLSELNDGGGYGFKKIANLIENQL